MTDLLWADDPDGGPDNAEACIRSHLSRMRFILEHYGIHIISIHGEGYKLALDDGVDVEGVISALDAHKMATLEHRQLGARRRFKRSTGTDKAVDPKGNAMRLGEA